MQSTLPTRKTFDLPSVMLVGVPARLANACAELLSPMAVLRVGHVVAACERLVVTKPLLIVLGALEPDTKVEPLFELARAVSAEVVHLSELGPEESVPARVCDDALAIARARGASSGTYRTFNAR